MLQEAWNGHCNDLKISTNSTWNLSCDVIVGKYQVIQVYELPYLIGNFSCEHVAPQVECCQVDAATKLNRYAPTQEVAWNRQHRQIQKFPNFQWNGALQMVVVKDQILQSQ